MEKRTDNGICCIDPDHYGHSFEVVSKLVSEAKKDFPYLEDKDISIHTLFGNYRSGYMCILFPPPKGSQIPESYNRWKIEPSI